MASLLSLAYLAPAMIGKNLITAMWEGNRAEAWFQIRYTWKEGVGDQAQFNNGWAKRHYLEAQMFGLYDDPNAM